MTTYFNAPTVCNICKLPLGKEMVDGRTHWRVWACMCTRCYVINGVGLGVGKGQHYRLFPDGLYHRTASTKQDAVHQRLLALHASHVPSQTRFG